jgi:hypothetical protein
MPRKSTETRLRATAVAVVALSAVWITAASAGPSAKRDASLILYAYPASAQTGRIELWTTNGAGGDARLRAVVTPAAGRALHGAQLTRHGDVVYAVSEAVDGNVDDLFLVDHRTRRRRFMFRVRGLRPFATSPEGSRIAYSRELPVAGKPAMFVANLDGSRRRQVAPVAASYALAWPVAETLFLVGGEGRCWYCALDLRTGARRSVPVPVGNSQGWPVVSPRADRVAFADLTGPAGERIYTTTGKLVRNLVGAGGEEAFWAPDERRLLIQSPGLEVFDFGTRRLTPFRHGGPASMTVLDWKSLGDAS